jgi:putative transposase
VRIDRGKDFLSRTVASVLAGFAVKVEDLPAYMPHLKGSVETVNGALERMFVAGLPSVHEGPASGQRPAGGSGRPGADL